MDNISRNLKITLVTLVASLIISYIIWIWWILDWEILFKAQSVIIAVGILVLITQYFIEKKKKDDYFKPRVMYFTLLIIYIVTILSESIILFRDTAFIKNTYMDIFKINISLVVLLIWILITNHIQSVKKIEDKY